MEEMNVFIKLKYVFCFIMRLVILFRIIILMIKVE